MNDPVLHLIGLAKKAGKLELGEEPVGAACRGHFARLVMLASDAADNSVRRAANFCQNASTPCLTLPHTKQELGFILGRSSVAMLAVTDSGFCAAITAKLAAQDSVKYENIAAKMKELSDRAALRKKEQKQHDKNGKKKRRAASAAAAPALASVKKTTSKTQEKDNTASPKKFSGKRLYIKQTPRTNASAQTRRNEVANHDK